MVVKNLLGNKLSQIGKVVPSSETDKLFMWEDHTQKAKVSVDNFFKMILEMAVHHRDVQALGLSLEYFGTDNVEKIAFIKTPFGELRARIEWFFGEKNLDVALVFDRNIKDKYDTPYWEKVWALNFERPCVLKSGGENPIRIDVLGRNDDSRWRESYRAIQHLIYALVEGPQF
ncbi:hypothetical protein [Corticimicrobacter populi]|uniref:Uncharacterized protein n=1 Tax=Corticimicrobacter populi TaxID=2175229 RepID=A0A2V1K198_9BURK|nr:hypothetical protein [Corticimicrobacter populi]PWF25044.1 hypothetical protein DD235_02425 [Corticimicrobacter populi]